MARSFDGGDTWLEMFSGDPQAVYFMKAPLIFFDGFESADLGKWSSSTGAR